MYIISAMDIVKELSALGMKIRSDKKIPLRQPILDFAFGWNDAKKIFYLEKEYVSILAECLNIYDLGYDFSDNDFYYLFDIEPPKGDQWITDTKNGMWLSLNLNVPKWLSDIGEDRKNEREAIMARKIVEKGNF